MTTTAMNGVDMVNTLTANVNNINNNTNTNNSDDSNENIELEYEKRIPQFIYDYANGSLRKPTTNNPHNYTSTSTTTKYETFDTLIWTTQITTQLTSLVKAITSSKTMTHH